MLHSTVGTRMRHPLVRRRLTAGLAVLACSLPLLGLTRGNASGTLGDGIAITRGCTPASTAMSADESLTATGEVENDAQQAVTLQQVELTAQGPSGQSQAFAGGLSDVVLSPGQSVPVSGSLALTTSDPAGAWSCAVSFESSTGEWYSSTATAFSVGTVLADGIAITRSCQLSTTELGVGQSVHAEGEIQNTTSRPLTLANAVLAARGPQHQSLGDFAPDTGTVTLAPGQSLALIGNRVMAATDPSGQWICYVTVESQAGSWYWGSSTTFSLGAAAAIPAQPGASGQQPDGIAVIRDCSLSSPEAQVGSVVTASGAVRNDTDADVTLQNLVLAARGPGGSTVGDFAPSDSSVLLTPGESMSLTASLTIGSTAPGGGWICYVAFREASGPWYWGSSAPLSVGSVEPDGIAITGNCSLADGALTGGETAHAQGDIENTSATAVHLSDVTLAARGPAHQSLGDFTPDTGAVTLAPGQSLAIAGNRSFTAADPTGSWICYVAFLDNGSWYWGSSATLVYTNAGSAPPTAPASPPPSATAAPTPSAPPTPAPTPPPTATPTAAPTATPSPTPPPTTGSSGAQPVGPAAGPWALNFDDEFSGNSLDTNDWSTGWFGSGVTGPVQSNETVCYDPTHATVAGGELTLSLTAQSSSCDGVTKPDTAAMITSNGLYSFTYGYAEASIYLPASGSEIADWPAFWLDGQAWPQDGEIDVLEGLSGNACYHFHYPGGGPGGCVTTQLAGGWHTFGVDWEPNAITYYYDGTEVGQITTGVTNQPMYLILNLSASAEYGGPTVTPSSMEVAYVRVWQHP